MLNIRYTKKIERSDFWFEKSGLFFEISSGEAVISHKGLSAGTVSFFMAETDWHSSVLDKILISKSASDANATSGAISLPQ